jgi:hypothetical protein
MAAHSSAEDAIVDFSSIRPAHDGDASAIWSIDGVHLDHMPSAAGRSGPA